MRILQTFVTGMLLALSGLVFAGSADAQQYPSRPITFIVPFPAGGLSDIVARTTAQELSKRIGASVVVENKAGASGTVGAGFVARSAPDGYTLLVTAIGDVTSLHYMKLNYNILTDFKHISLLAEGPPLVLIVNPSLPFKTVAELVADAKAHPGKLSFGSSGPGTSPAIAIAQLKSMAKIDIVDVPYRGVTQAAVAVMANEIQASIPFLANVKAMADQGKVRILATTGAKRNPSIPDVPTMIELGYPGFQHEAFVGLAAPVNTPADIVAMLNKEVSAIVREESFVKRFAPNGMRAPAPKSLDEVTAYMRQQVERNGEFAKMQAK
jgi:tripartite-type tricarboxylate transporter receptor subunit TctC